MTEAATKSNGSNGAHATAKFDAVVVGAGAGGAAAAYGLCQRGMSVLLLDAGPWFNPIVDYPLTESDWEARDFPEKPGSAASVTFAPGQKLTGAEPLLVSGSKGMGALVTSGTRWMGCPAINAEVQGGFEVSHTLTQLELRNLDTNKPVANLKAVWGAGPKGDTARLHVNAQDPFAWLTPHKKTLTSATTTPRSS